MHLAAHRLAFPVALPAFEVFPNGQLQGQHRGLLHLLTHRL